MKKIKNNSYIWALIGLFMAFSCSDPLADELAAINAETSTQKDIVYTLTDDDYDTADDACDCSGFGNFSSEDDAKIGVPAVLADVFPALGDKSSALVTYDVFNGSSPDLRGTNTVATVSAQDYTDLGYTRFANFGNVDDDVVEWAEFKLPDARDGDFADVTFDVFTGGSFTADTTSRVVYTVAYGWQYAFILPEDAYGDFFGESGIDFSDSDEGKDKMPVYLNEFNSLFVDEGTTLVAQFNFDDRNFDDPETGSPNVPDVGLYIFSGGEWLLYNDHFQTTAESLSFGHDGTVWVPDNTIKYTLGTADYSAIATSASGTNSAGADSMDSFGNYDLTLWSTQEIFDTITARLLVLYPNQEAGQKYLVDYAVWRPGSGVDQLNVIWDGSEFSVIEAE